MGDRAWEAKPRAWVPAHARVVEDDWGADDTSSGSIDAVSTGINCLRHAVEHPAPMCLLAIEMSAVEGPALAGEFGHAR